MWTDECTTMMQMQCPPGRIPLTSLMSSGLRPQSLVIVTWRAMKSVLRVDPPPPPFPYTSVHPLPS